MRGHEIGPFDVLVAEADHLVALAHGVRAWSEGGGLSVDPVLVAVVRAEVDTIDLERVDDLEGVRGEDHGPTLPAFETRDPAPGRESRVRREAGMHACGEVAT